MPEEDRAQATESTALLREIEADFREELSAQGYKGSLWDLIKASPATMVLILAVFALVVVVGKAFAGLAPELMANAVQFNVLSVQLNELNESAEAQVTVLSKIDYSAVQGFSGLLGAWIGGMLSTVKIQFTKPIDIAVRKESQVVHVATACVPTDFNVNLGDLSETVTVANCSVSNIGRAETVKYVAHKLMAGEPVEFEVSAVVKQSKWGFVFSVPVSMKIPFAVEDPEAGLGKIISIDVSRRQDNSLVAQVTSEVEFASVVSGTVPVLAWILKLPGCDEKSITVVDNALSDSFTLVAGDSAFNISMMISLDNLPELLTAPCPGKGHKSPLDTWLSRYLDGESNVIYVQGGSEVPILDDLLSGYDLPLAISGKSLDDKLVDQVAVDHCEIEYGSFNDVLITANVVVHVKLPGVIHMRRDLLVAVSSVRGPVYLFDEGVRMGGIYIDEWTPTVTVPQPDGFQITLFLDRAPFEVENAAQFAKFSRELLLRGHAPLEFQTLLDLSIQSPVGDVTLQGMYFQGQTEVYK